MHALVVYGAPKHGIDVASSATECPVKGIAVFTDDFGELRSGGVHPGIDMGAVTDTPVVAVADGVWRHDVGGDGGNGVVAHRASTTCPSTTRTSRTTPTPPRDS